MQKSTPRRPPLALLVGALLSSLAIGGAAVALLVQRVGAPVGGGSAAPLGPAPGFVLTDQLGRPLSDTDLRGKVELRNVRLSHLSRHRDNNFQ